MNHDAKWQGVWVSNWVTDWQVSCACQFVPHFSIYPKTVHSQGTGWIPPPYNSDLIRRNENKFVTEPFIMLGSTSLTNSKEK